ncbi:DUF1772 domain-containing protein [uncultured Phycicoccus sp.]|uniref:anthrone oxygenase family protein n=1 Tax=uncultured Phycicoccus sp. TaxID=661422 RepID=UPI00261AED00|nr:anthrone oxygenase family protein [uncultured Phycicoccus sp.]
MRAPVVLSVVASVATALNAGVFFAFSTFVMRAVDDLGPAGSVRAMQEINRRAPTPAFMTLLFGSTLLALGSGVVALVGAGPGRWWAVAGAVAAVAALLVTIAVNIPLNQRLDRADPGGPDSADRWREFAAPWLRANHARGVLGVLASLLLAVAAVAAG